MDETRTCATWTEHSWRRTGFVEAGRHPRMGRFNRFSARCENCGQETLETEWTELPAYGQQPGGAAWRRAFAE